MTVSDQPGARRGRASTAVVMTTAVMTTAHSQTDVSMPTREV